MIKECDIVRICPYCSVEVSGRVWRSDFDIDIHYKSLKCGCGKKISVKLDFITSGEWERQQVPEKKEGQKMHTLETKIKLLKEYPTGYAFQGVKNG